jgi:hypothetical protein
MESLMAAQHYCLVTTCRRQFLLGHFGEKSSDAGCGLAFTLDTILIEMLSILKI